MPEKAVYPDPLVVPPRRLPHLQSIIILHGRGGNALAFGPELLIQQPLGDATGGRTNLPDLFPHASFIFPTAALRQAAGFGRIIIRQWFDHWKFPAPNEFPDMMIESLRESTALIQGLVRDEIQKVGAENVVLGGLSQGCATVLATMILDSGARKGAQEEIPAAYFGMCGWLPFAEHIESEVSAATMDESLEDVDDEMDPFGGENTDSERQTPLAATRSMLRFELDLPTPPGEEVDMFRPVFLGHGCLDDKVSINLGRQAHECLSSLALDVRWKEYELLDHWYSDDMLYDIVKFLREKTGWEIEGWVEKAENAENADNTGGAGN